MGTPSGSNGAEADTLAGAGALSVDPTAGEELHISLKMDQVVIESLPPGDEQPAFLAVKQAWYKEKREDGSIPEPKVDNRDALAACIDSKALQLSGEATQPLVDTKSEPSQREQNRASLVRPPCTCTHATVFFLPWRWHGLQVVVQ